MRRHIQFLKQAYLKVGLFFVRKKSVAIGLGANRQSGDDCLLSKYN